jgi:hypothetical protein
MPDVEEDMADAENWVYVMEPDLESKCQFNSTTTKSTVMCPD